MGEEASRAPQKLFAGFSLKFFELVDYGEVGIMGKLFLVNRSD